MAKTRKAQNRDQREVGDVRRVALLDDHPVTRRGLAEIVEENGDLTIMWEGSDPTELWNLAEQKPPHLFVLDLALKMGDGLKLTRALQYRWPEIPTLVLSMYDEVLYGERALRAGAKGYVMKSSPLEIILAAMRDVCRGEMYLSERMKRRVLNTVISHSSRPHHGANGGMERFTDRELDVFRYIGQGYSIKNIGKQLGLSPKTVESYRTQIKEKLDLKGSSELIIYAAEWFRYGRGSCQERVDTGPVGESGGNGDRASPLAL